MEYYEKIAKILRTDKENITNVQNFLGDRTGITGVIDKLGKENDENIEKCLSSLGASKDSSAKHIFDLLIKKIDKDSKSISELVGNPSCNNKEGCLKLANFVSNLYKHRGVFLKKDKFIEILEKEPPKKILSMLGYNTVSDLIKNENWMEVASALRFVEGMSWMNEKFLVHYKELTNEDFEERDVNIIAISDRWREEALKFERKKYHNISHLKELGIIFIIPTEYNLEGEIMRSIALLLHYIHEIEFYSSIFVSILKSDKFGEKLIELLRGDVKDDHNISVDNSWLIVQRYLSKIDEYDWRLFVPHINPEAIHWEKAERDIARIGSENGIDSLTFWEGLNWIGDYFNTDVGVEVLVSFNLVDTIMALVKEKEMIKYLYHHQESLWNKIFSMYFGYKGMENMIKENIFDGVIKFN